MAWSGRSLRPATPFTAICSIGWSSFVHTTCSYAVSQLGATGAPCGAFFCHSLLFGRREPAAIPSLWEATMRHCSLLASTAGPVPSRVSPPRDDGFGCSRQIRGDGCCWRLGESVRPHVFSRREHFQPPSAPREPRDRDQATKLQPGCSSRGTAPRPTEMIFSAESETRIRRPDCYLAVSSATRTWE